MSVSKKSSEFDRYDRMRKLQREAEVEKRKASGGKKKGGRPKQSYTKSKFRYEEEDFEDGFLIDLP